MEVISFRRELNRVSALCRQMAEEALLKGMRDQFPNHALCWKVLRKLRSLDQSVAIDIGTLQQHFSSIYHRRDRPLIQAPDQVEGWGETLPGDVHFDAPFSDRELQRALRELNGQAGTGPERVPSQTIKDVFSDLQVRPILLLLMNACFQEGALPADWGLAELFVLFKGKGLPTVSDNYRAIALSNDFRRIFERLVQARLSAWSRLNNATGSMQFGFKSGTGTMDAIFVLRTFMFFVTRILKVPGYAVFIDLKMAFPTLSRSKTLDVLRQKRVPKKITPAVAMLMSGTVQRLRVNGKLTELFPVMSGTPEGSINSPEIFAIVYKAVLQKMDIHELPSDFRQIERGKVYYIVFADDLSFFSLDLQPLEDRTNEFDSGCVEYDMALNRAKSKWMAFLSESPSDLPERRHWKISVGGELLENVDEFVYLGYKLDVKLDDTAHTKMIRERYIRAAQVTGQLMRDLQCVNFLNLQQFFLSLVFSQLYGLIFIDEEKVEFERGVGVFVKRALGLPESLPHTVALAMLGVKHVKTFQYEQRSNFLIRWEKKEVFPVFEALAADRIDLFPVGVGLNAKLGEMLDSVGLPRTMDFCEFYREIGTVVSERTESEHRGRLLAAEGRAFWTELSSNGFLSTGLKQVLSRLTFDSLRIVAMMFADVLCWSALKRPNRTCPSCREKFTSAHFFSCPNFFPYPVLGRNSLKCADWSRGRTLLTSSSPCSRNGCPRRISSGILLDYMSWSRSVEARMSITWPFAGCFANYISVHPPNICGHELMRAWRLHLRFWVEDHVKRFSLFLFISPFILEGS